MPVFSYKALATSGGAPATGVVVADTPRQARDQLRARGLLVEHLVPAKESAPGPRSPALSFLPQRQRHATKVLTFTRELSTLLAVGIPLLESIDMIAAQHRGPFHTSLTLLRDRIASGGTLADAMRGQPRTFDDLTTSIVEVGESTGALETALSRLAEFKERTAAVRNRVATALIYPAIVLTMAVGVSVLLMTVVVPNLLSALTDAGKPLPLPTRVVKAMSDLLVNNWLPLSLGAVLAAGGLAVLLNTPRGRRAFHTFQLRLPLIGPLLRKQAVVRIAVVMSTLLKSGIVFTRALEVARKTTTNLLLQDALEQIERNVTSGRALASAVTATGAFPPVVAQVFAVGQESGRLEELLDRLATDYDAQVNLATQRLTAVLEPALILLLVLLVGFIGFATVMPLMEAADAL